MLKPWPLVGRRSELDAVEAALSRPGLGGVVFSGAAGVGKTRLATECLRLGEAAGFVTASALATRAAATIPLAALAPLLPAEPDADIGSASLVRAARALVESCGDRSLMLLVDDAQHLDAASSTVVHYLARNPKVFVVVTLRSGEATSDAIAALWKDELALRIDVRPLDRPDTERLLSAALGSDVDGAAAHQLWRSSEGNPLLLRELLLGAQETNLLVNQHRVWRLVAPLGASARLSELIDARLQDLSASARAALELVALGEPLGLDIMSALGAVEDIEVLEARGLIRFHVDGRRREVRLAHPVHGEVVRNTLPALRAMAIERRLSEAVRASGARRRDDRMRVAVWALASGSSIEPAELVDAAHYAWFANDYALAERLARAAIATDRADMMAHHLLGEVLARLGRPEEGEVALQRAAALATLDREHALVALTRAGISFWGLDRREDAATILRDAVREMPEGAWRDELLGELATYDLLNGHLARAIEQAEVIVERADSPRALVVGAIAGAPALAVTGRTDEALALADRALLVHLELGEQVAMADPGIHLVSRCLALIEAGALQQATDTATFGYTQAVTDGAREGHAWFALMLGRGTWLGDPRAALRWFTEGAAAFGDIGQRGPQRWCLAGAALSAMTVGDRAADGLLAAALELPGRPFGMMQSDVLRARGWCAVAHGELGNGRRLIDDAIALASEQGAHSLEVAALHDQVRLGFAGDVVDRLQDAASEVDGVLAEMQRDHAIAFSKDDAEGLAAVAENFAAIGARVLGAEAAAHAAGVVRRAGDRRTAEGHAHRAHELARAAGGVSTPALVLVGDAATLTRRELEIATLAACGRSNPDIAAALFLSVRTVANHLQRAYDKLGVKGRDGLAHALSRQN